MKFWLFWRRRAKSKRAGMPRGHKVVSRPFGENQPEDLSLLTSAATPIRSSRRKEALDKPNVVKPSKNPRLQDARPGHQSFIILHSPPVGRAGAAAPPKYCLFLVSDLRLPTSDMPPPSKPRAGFPDCASPLALLPAPTSKRPSRKGIMVLSYFLPRRFNHPLERRGKSRNWKSQEKAED